MSETNFVVGIMEVFKKLMTTWLNRSRSAGYRLKACYSRQYASEMMHARSARCTYDFGQDLTNDADEFVVYELATLQAGLFKSLDLLLDDNFKSSSTDEERWCRTLLRMLVNFSFESM